MTLSLVMDRLSTRRLVKSGALIRPDEGFEMGFERGFEQGLRHQLRQAQGLGGRSPAAPEGGGGAGRTDAPGRAPGVGVGVDIKRIASVSGDQSAGGQGLGGGSSGGPERRGVGAESLRGGVSH